MLITGSSGFVGGKLKGYFQKKYDVKTFSLKKQSIEEFDFDNIDTIIHCAALVHQKKKFDYETYFDINVAYPLNLAKKAKKSGVGHFIFMSSVSVYGDMYDELREDLEPQPSSFYGKSKLEAEKKLLELNDKNFIVSIVRMPMVYGYNAPGNMKSLITLVDKIPILPFKNVQNQRSFLFVDNLYDFLDKVIDLKKDGVFLICDDDVVSIGILAKTISEALHKKRFFIQVPFFIPFLKKVRPTIYKKIYGDLYINNIKTKQKLNYSTMFSLKKGIKTMILGESSATNK